MWMLIDGQVHTADLSMLKSLLRKEQLPSGTLDDITDDFCDGIGVYIANKLNPPQYEKLAWIYEGSGKWYVCPSKGVIEKTVNDEWGVTMIDADDIPFEQLDDAWLFAINHLKS